MNNQEMELKARELRQMRRMKEELDAEIVALEDAIKAEMTSRNVDMLVAGEYKIKWSIYTTNRFDTTRFRNEHADLAAAYTKATQCRRFTIS